MTRNNKKFNLLNIKTSIIECLKQHKLKSLIIAIFILIAFLTGLIIAIRTRSDWGTGEGFGVVDTRTGVLTTTFLTRLLSMTFVFLILLGCCFCKFLFPIAVLFLSYRAYLLGLNITLLIIFYGMSGAIFSILIALPCQLLALLILSFFYILFYKTNKDSACYGGGNNRQKFYVCLAAFILLLSVCLLESVLLFIFSPRMILVIWKLKYKNKENEKTIHKRENFYEKIFNNLYVVLFTSYNIL